MRDETQDVQNLSSKRRKQLPRWCKHKLANLLKELAIYVHGNPFMSELRLTF